LVLATPWTIATLGADGRLWESVRLAVDGLQLDRVEGEWVYGVADSSSVEPKSLRLNVHTREILGGADVA